MKDFEQERATWERDMATLTSEKKNLEGQLSQIKRDKTNMENQLSIQSQVSNNTIVFYGTVVERVIWYISNEKHDVKP